MAVPTLKEQKLSDLNQSYDPDWPWVEMATTQGVTGDFPVRIVLRNPSQGQEKEYQHQMIFVRVRKSDWVGPVYGSVLTFAGQDWSVEQVAHAGEEEWSLVVNREVRPVF